MQPWILFGGTFDPIHNGHLLVAQDAKKFFNAEKVIFIPAKNPCWKDPTSSQIRLKMLSLAIKGHPDFDISTYELEQEDPVSYTVNTVDYFLNKYPGRKFYFLLGFDQMDQLDNWHEVERLTKEIQIIAYARPGYPKNHEAVKKYHIQVIESKLYDVSSTDIRLGKDLQAPLQVLNYIAENKLYFVKSLSAYLKEHRFKHSLSVANTSYQYALANGLDPFKAYQAGLFHDIGKDLPQEEQAKVMKTYFPQFQDLPSFSYHQFVSEFLAKNFFGITYKDVLSAIEFHCTGKARMSKMDKCIYAADKTEPTRDYDTKAMYQACLNNLNEGFIKVLKEHQDYFKTNGIDFTSNYLTRRMYACYINPKEKKHA